MKANSDHDAPTLPDAAQTAREAAQNMREATQNMREEIDKAMEAARREVVTAVRAVRGVQDVTVQTTLETIRKSNEDVARAVSSHQQGSKVSSQQSTPTTDAASTVMADLLAEHAKLTKVA